MTAMAHIPTSVILSNILNEINTMATDANPAAMATNA